MTALAGVPKSGGAGGTTLAGRYATNLVCGP
ncbi:MAG: hypothetical protein QOE97_1186 [Pseudonocardiales bacterium]|nr:hypothetical protein [Pseudonocardiales bacterium]